MEHTQTIRRNLTGDESALLKCILYFAVFNYPLTERELFENSRVSCPRSRMPGLLQALQESGFVRKYGEFYLLADAEESAILRRLKGNAGAAGIMDTAYRYSRRIASFPFVRGVCLSGALSKNYYDEKGDIDYFIITEPGRLWICRTLLILRYKLMRKSKKKFWCVNYFVSADNLVIPDQNAFTGTELAHLVPTYNYSVYRDLLDANQWYRGNFPNKEPLPDDRCARPGTEIFKKTIETIFTGWGGVLDDILLRATLRRWRTKFPGLPGEDFELQFRSRKNVCKRHTVGFQKKVLGWWSEKQEALQQTHNINLA